ncbi:ATP-binding cassette domain-containing protein [Streptomyces parvus]|uniref:ATP-binding cassette domain-containing protein n=1 Tax=Streptomyces parvus TaxID=66428 RepID=UPI003630D8B6
MGGSAIRTRQLTKHFGAVRALAGVDLEVPAGSVLGLLGHNGAGKTTLIQILSTVLPPSGGSAEVAGFDIVRDARRVRACIGVTGQFAALDEHLSGLANLVLISRLLGARPREARRRAAELVEQFGLTEAADRPMRTYSGGMRRRIDLAASLVARPSVLFLDEPTTGLDPVSRTALWETVEGLVAEGTTVLLTTQYLDEADRLADRIAVLSSGHVVTVGTAAELKAAGTRSVRLTFGSAADLESAEGALRLEGLGLTTDPVSRTVSLPLAATAELAGIFRILGAAGVELAELALKEPTLDDVYLSLAESWETTSGGTVQC